MTRFRQLTILSLILLVSALIFPGGGRAWASPRPVDAPQTLQRFAVFEAFLRST